MRQSIVKRTFAILLSASMAMTLCAPATTALAEPRAVEIQNHARAGEGATVGNVRIDGVDAPRAGAPLDDAARVTAKPDAAWDIPVLWVSDDLALATEAQEGRTYLPVLAFYVPQGYSLSGDAATVELSDSLTALFGGAEVVSVYNEATGITYILPASLRDLFAASQREAAATSAWTPERQTAAHAGDPSDIGEVGGYAERSLVDIYCARTARDALTDDDLAWLIDLIINRLEPQAVELLLNSFPAFRTAAKSGGIGKEIGLYIYYLKGDNDGLKEHDGLPESSLAFISGSAVKYDSGHKFCYMIGVSVADLLEKDDNNKPVRDKTTGKFRLLRTGGNMDTLENTLVHELFHALMDDYNRTGMLGVTKISDYSFDDKGVLISSSERYNKLHLPTWFVEGTASAVENTYTYRTYLFDGLRTGANGKLEDQFSAETLVEAYLNGKVDGKPAFYDLGNCDTTEKDNGVGNLASAYVSGYLASLYLANLASIKNTGSSAIIIKGNVIDDVSTERLRMGLNSILERMHNGETLDQVIADISPTDASGQKAYKNTQDFQDKFIKGTPTPIPGGYYEWGTEGDIYSSYFVRDYLNHLKYVSGLSGRANKANGSILLPSDTDQASPLDNTKSVSSDCLKIVESNQEIPSTVPDEEALKSAGRSNPDAPAAEAAPKQSAQSEPAPAAEGTPQQKVGVTAASEPAPVAEPAAAPAAATEPAPAPVPASGATTAASGTKPA